MMSRPLLFGVACLSALLAAIWMAAWSGLILGNATTSVPRGLYRKAEPDAATHVTFCLGERHRLGAWYLRFCSPDHPDGVPILKRVGEHPGNRIIVEGDGPRALDSSVLGPIRVDEIRGWWVPVVQFGAKRNGG